MWQCGTRAKLVDNVARWWKRQDLVMSFICRNFVVCYNGNKAFSVYVVRCYYYQLIFNTSRWRLTNQIKMRKFTFHSLNLVFASNVLTCIYCLATVPLNGTKIAMLACLILISIVAIGINVQNNKPKPVYNSFLGYSARNVKKIKGPNVNKFLK